MPTVQSNMGRSIPSATPNKPTRQHNWPHSFNISQPPSLEHPWRPHPPSLHLRYSLYNWLDFLSPFNRLFFHMVHSLRPVWQQPLPNTTHLWQAYLPHKANWTLFTDLTTDSSSLPDPSNTQETLTHPSLDSSFERPNPSSLSPLEPVSLSTM